MFCQKQNHLKNISVVEMHNEFSWLFEHSLILLVFCSIFLLVLVSLVSDSEHG
jgi:hypothetical protein